MGNTQRKGDIEHNLQELLKCIEFINDILIEIRKPW